MTNDPWELAKRLRASFPCLRLALDAADELERLALAVRQPLSNDQSNALSNTSDKSNRQSNKIVSDAGTFDKRSYQRNYMRARRAKGVKADKPSAQLKP